MRIKIVAGNWKMNLSYDEANTLNTAIDKAIKEGNSKCDVYHFVPSIYLKSSIDTCEKVNVGAQNAYPKESGAFTGEISMKQIKDLGANAVLVGHSERRQIFNEDNALLKEKVFEGIKQDLKVFFCCGESLEEREANRHKEVISQQLIETVFHLDEKDFKEIVIAYEPIWAIGTGKTASAEQANEIHQHIRGLIAEKYSEEVAQTTTILYGGSCNPSNAETLFSQSDIDGGLIGGASLKPEDFLSIISVFNS